MSKFSHFAVKKLYFKQCFNNISGNCGLLFSQINFDQKYFGGFLARGVVQGFMSGKFSRGGAYVPEPFDDAGAAAVTRQLI